MAEELESNEELQDVESTKEVVEDAAPKEGLEGTIDQYKNIVIFAILILIGGIIGGYMYFDGADEAEAEAQMEIYRAQYFFGQDSMQLALTGNGSTVTGFEDIADSYDGTSAGNISNFYIAVIKMREGSFEDAIAYLDEFEADDLLIQSRAYALRGDANLELGNVEEAIVWYTKATENKPTEQFTPAYYLKLAIAYEVKADKESALKTYEALIKEFPTARKEGEVAKKYAAQLRAELKKD
jgi:TolA-binding protein